MSRLGLAGVFARKGERGQLIMYDLLLASILFIFLIGAALSVWNANVGAVQQQNIREMSVRAGTILEVFVRSPGHPYNWEKLGGEPEVIGLAKSDRILDNDKVLAFAAMDYDDGRAILGADGYDFLLEIDSNSTDLNIGQQPSGEVFKVRLRRVVAYKEEVTRVALTLYVQK